MDARSKIDREAEEAATELDALNEEAQQAEASKLKSEQERPTARDIDDIFSDEGTGLEAPPVTDSGSTGGKEVPAATSNNSELLAEIAKLRAEASDFEHKFKTIQGMYNKSETLKLREELDDLKRQLAAKPAGQAQDHSAIDEDLVAELGERPAKMITALQAQITSLENALSDVTGQVKATGEQTGYLANAQVKATRERYYKALNTLAPDWDKINGNETTPQDARFTVFAAKTIPGSDETYDGALKRHHANNNVAKVAEIFNLFKQSVDELSATTSSTKKDETVTEPTRTGGGTPPPQPKSAKRTFTQTQVDEFDRLYAARKLKGDPAKIEAMFNEIQDAIAEGRVR